MERRQSNFDFLETLDRELANLGRLSESYFQDDPGTCVFKLRQYCERLARRHAAMVGIEVQNSENQAEVLKRLRHERAELIGSVFRLHVHGRSPCKAVAHYAAGRNSHPFQTEGSRKRYTVNNDKTIHVLQ